MKPVDLTEFLETTDTPETRAFEHTLDFIYQVIDRMEDLGLTKTELARKMGISLSQLSRYLNTNANMTLKTMAKFELALDCHINIDFIRNDDNSEFANIEDSYDFENISDGSVNCEDTESFTDTTTDNLLKEDDSKFIIFENSADYAQTQNSYFYKILYLQNFSLESDDKTNITSGLGNVIIKITLAFR